MLALSPDKADTLSLGVYKTEPSYTSNHLTKAWPGSFSSLQSLKLSESLPGANMLA